MTILTRTDDDLRAALKGARVLVTGGAGFIGGHLTAALLDAGAHVVRVDRHPERAHPALPDGGPPTRGAEVGSAAFRDLLRREGPFDWIFHLGGRANTAASVADPRADFASNLVATLDLLEALRAMPRPSHLLFASSAAVYGNPARVPIEATDSAVPISPYGVSKLAAERYLAVYARLYGLPAAALRLFSVYGPGQTKQVVYDLLTKLHASPRELHLLGDGTQVRDFVYVADVVRAFLVVAVRGRRDGAVYNVASGTGASTAELARALLALQGADARLTFAGAGRAGDPERWIGDNRDLRALGGAPRHTLEEGLRATVAWFNASVGQPALAHEVLHR